MVDVHNNKTRSFNMSRIRSKNTTPEMVVLRFLFSGGFRYKLHDKDLLGKPDLVFPKYKTVIFVHGYFWHGHEDCRYFGVPKTRAAWWLKKIGRNQDRDRENTFKLESTGWRVLTVFECSLRPKVRDLTLTTISSMLKGK